MKKTALIILNYNNSRDTRNCIESILLHNTAPVKFVVIDNASSADQLETLKGVLTQLFPNGYTTIEGKNDYEGAVTLGNCTLVVNEKNLGYACGNNIGLQLVKHDVDVDKVMILNNDILFVEDILPPLIQKLYTLPKCALVSPVLYKKDMDGYDYNCARLNVKVSQLISANFLHYYRRLIKSDATAVEGERFLLNKCKDISGSLEVELPSGSCMLLEKDLFEKIGFFDPNTFLYYEENILYKRISSLGLKIYISLEDKCIHLGASTMKSIPKNKWIMETGKRSELYYVKKYSGANPFMKIIHRASVYFFLMTFNLQKALSR